MYITILGKAQSSILKLTSVFHHLNRVGPEQSSGLAHLGCTCKVSTGTLFKIHKGKKNLLCSSPYMVN